MRPAPPAQSTGLARYVVAATLARSADGGAVVAVVLLVTTSGAPAWLAGLLGACITAPHLFGPFVAGRLDSARDGRSVIALACMLHGATLAAAVLLFPVTWPVVTAVLLVASGLVGPLLTGGISSRLPDIAGPELSDQRRAQGWDVATYGIAGTIGPALVAVLSAWSGPTTAALVLAGATFAAAGVIKLLPYSQPAAAASEVPQPAQTLVMMLSAGPLRRTLYLTVVVAVSVAVLPITAVASTGDFGVEPAAAGVLAAAYGLGGLAGSAGVMLRPLQGDADRLMTWLATAVAVTLAAAACAGSFFVAVVTYSLVGIMNSYFFAATLAARSEYAPPEARGQVFVWVGALKISAGSAGTAMAGAVVLYASQLPLLLSVAVITAAVGASVLDRRAGRELDPR